MTIFGPAVSAPTDTDAASWINARVGDFGKVGGLVPDGFDRYLLVRPAMTVDGGGVDETNLLAPHDDTGAGLVRDLGGLRVGVAPTRAGANPSVGHPRVGPGLHAQSVSRSAYWKFSLPRTRRVRG